MPYTLRQHCVACGREVTENQNLCLCDRCVFSVQAMEAIEIGQMRRAWYPLSHRRKLARIGIELIRWEYVIPSWLRLVIDEFTQVDLETALIEKHAIADLIARRIRQEYGDEHDIEDLLREREV